MTYPIVLSDAPNAVFMVNSGGLSRILSRLAQLTSDPQLAARLLDGIDTIGGRVALDLTDADASVFQEFERVVALAIRRGNELYQLPSGKRTSLRRGPIGLVRSILQEIRRDPRSATADTR